MKHLTHQERAAVKAALETRLNGLAEVIQSSLSERERLSFNEILGRSNGDSSDEALAITLGDVSEARLTHEIRQWRELKVAEQRLADAEDFGLCEACGDPIPVPRLLAQPAASRCTDCQTRFEHTHAMIGNGTL